MPAAAGAAELTGWVVTGDGLHTNRANATFLREGKHAHYLLQVLENQPRLFAALDGLNWRRVPIAAVTEHRAAGCRTLTWISRLRRVTTGAAGPLG